MPGLTQRRRTLDARSLVALAHPLRIRLRNELRRSGPATASQLARKFGESSGATSYHLRMLARHGFIEADDQFEGGRERWWRAAPEVLVVGSDIAADTATRAALHVLTSEVRREADQHLQAWLEDAGRWTETWRKASADSVYLGRLNAEQTTELRDLLEQVVTEYVGREPGEGARTVELHLNLFPLGDPE